MNFYDMRELIAYSAPWFGGALLIGAAIYDWRTCRLPDVFTLYAGSIIILLYCHIQGVAFAIGGALFGFAALKIFQILYKRSSGVTGIGSGDVKFMLPVGAMVGPTGVPPALILATLTAMGASAIFRHRGRMPFGPYIAFGGITVSAANQLFDFASMLPW